MNSVNLKDIIILVSCSKAECFRKFETAGDVLEPYFCGTHNEAKLQYAQDQENKTVFERMMPKLHEWHDDAMKRGDIELVEEISEAILNLEAAVEFCNGDHDIAIKGDDEVKFAGGVRTHNSSVAG